MQNVINKRKKNNNATVLYITYIAIKRKFCIILTMLDDVVALKYNILLTRDYGNMHISYSKLLVIKKIQNNLMQ